MIACTVNVVVPGGYLGWIKDQDKNIADYLSTFNLNCPKSTDLVDMTGKDLPPPPLTVLVYITQ